MDSETRPMGRISQFHPNSRKSTEFLGGQRGMLSGGSRGIVTAALVRHLTPPRACLGVFKVAERDGSTDRVIKGRGSSRDSSHRSRPACPPIVEWLTETLDKAGSTRARPTGMDLGAFVLVLVGRQKIIQARPLIIRSNTGRNSYRNRIKDFDHPANLLGVDAIDGITRPTINPQ
ncbi:hypothetical protein J6590_029440 [Homalodisca vitripennis]|nr:hypothetical protein J6590_029440 [Homalodisca vitripennis]